jgi:phytoene dehydrogenase-like protein
MDYDLVIVGGGLAGLSCARRVQQSGLRFLLLEASGGVGGRIRTDRVEGFQLDRGFQVFLTAYPEARQTLDYAQLELKAFEPGALVRSNGAFHRLSDPWRRPSQAMLSLFTPIGTFLDKARVGGLRSRAMKSSIEHIFAEPETTTREALNDAGFSVSMVERFFQPFLGGIFLESELRTSSRMFNFVFRMFSSGDACLPANGMEAIPRQLAETLPAGSVRLQSRVTRIQPGMVQLDTGETIQAKRIAVAVEAPVAAQLLDAAFPVESNGVTCLYFASEQAPIEMPLLVLNGEGRGPVNNLCAPSVVSPSYAPPGQHLISATVLGVSEKSEKLLETEVRDQLAGWFGSQVTGWRHLRSYRIPYALPRQIPGHLSPPERPVRWQPGIYLCGDYRDNASINGAMVSGRRAAQAVLKDLS